nr:hypothetical protein CFP56_20576 [Quercus suber]
MLSYLNLLHIIWKSSLVKTGNISFQAPKSHYECRSKIVECYDHERMNKRQEIAIRDPSPASHEKLRIMTVLSEDDQVYLAYLISSREPEMFESAMD